MQCPCAAVLFCLETSLNDAATLQFRPPPATMKY
jgi:hypothetical protein